MSPYRASVPLTRDWQHFGFTVEGGIATIAFNRPDKLNALTFDVYADLRDLLSELPHRGDVRVLAMRECPVPIIAAINGIAAGAGSVIALASDLRVMAESASFAFLFTRVGLAGADMGSAYLLPRIVGLGRATELLLLGDKVPARRAYEIGLATAVVDDDALAASVAELAARLASGPAFAYATTKSLLTRELDVSLGAAIELEAITQALLMHSDDFAEFYEAWSEGRKPEWKGR